MTSHHSPKARRILIISDEVPLFFGIRAALQPAGEVDTHPDRAATVDDAIVRLRQTRYDALIWCIPARTGETIEIVARLKCQSPVTKVLIMGDAFTYADIVAAMRVGASGYIPRSFPFEELKGFFHKVFCQAGVSRRRGPAGDKIFDLERDGLFG